MTDLLTPQKSRRYYENFLIFTVFFCFLHAAADCVLAFSTSELGVSYGSNGALLVNSMYTMSTPLQVNSRLKPVTTVTRQSVTKKSLNYNLRTLFFIVNLMEHIQIG